MPNYKYKAINQSGETIESVLLASDEQDLQMQLQGLDMVLISAQPEKSKKSTSSYKSKVKGTVLTQFTKQLYTLLKAGLPIVSSINALKEQASDESFGHVLEQISSDIEQGSKFSDAINNFPKIFPPIFINTVRVGEESGTLEESLKYLYDYLEEDARMKEQVKKAFRYPTFVLIGIIGAFIVFMTTVIPNFIPMFESSGKELPLPTKIMIGLYDVIIAYGFYILLILLAIIVGIVAYIRTPSGRFQFDNILLKLPIIGDFVQKVNTSRFAMLFYTMNRTGISVTKAFEIMQKTMGNMVFNKELKKTADNIMAGEGIASSLKKSPLFTSLLVEMVSIGEASGALDEMLSSVSSYYDQEVTDAVNNMTAYIEPVVTVVLGGMILLLALALFLPMWDMMNAF
ncbi:MAG: hypothetical protein GF313_02605 [Caldithrix sp.]|nr:hypothetical protein [Caldithrix sp.]